MRWQVFEADQVVAEQVTEHEALGVDQAELAELAAHHGLVARPAPDDLVLIMR